ncbi:MAG: hypothetical protein ABSE85_13315 [Candidatus Korobacteraceae bacterium]
MKPVTRSFTPLVTIFGIGEAAADQVHGIGVLGHRQIHQDSLGGEEIFYPLLHPSGQQRNKG